MRIECLGRETILYQNKRNSFLKRFPICIFVCQARPCEKISLLPPHQNRPAVREFLFVKSSISYCHLLFFSHATAWQTRKEEEKREDIWRNRNRKTCHGRLMTYYYYVGLSSFFSLWLPFFFFSFFSPFFYFPCDSVDHGTRPTWRRFYLGCEFLVPSLRRQHSFVNRLTVH